MQMTISRLKHVQGIPYRTIEVDACRSCGTPCEWPIKDGNYTSFGCPNALCPSYRRLTSYRMMED